MHEMSLCESLIRLIEDQAEKDHFSRVKTVWLEIGELAAIEADALTFCFDVAGKGTIVENTKLIIDTVPGLAWCLNCEQQVAISDRLTPCPLCHSYHLEFQQGDEMKIKELEVY